MWMKPDLMYYACTYINIHNMFNSITFGNAAKVIYEYTPITARDWLAAWYYGS